MNDTDISPPATNPAEFAAGAIEHPPRAAIGSGVMAARSAHEETIAQRESLECAANDARATGHRFDLLRYLRLRRNRAHT